MKRKPDKKRKIFNGSGRKIRTVTLHDAKELDDDFRGRANQDLALATALGVDNVVLKDESACSRRTRVVRHSRGSH